MNSEDARASIYFLEQKNKELLENMARLTESMVTLNEDYESLFAEEEKAGNKEVRVTKLTPADAKNILSKIEVIERKIKQNCYEILSLAKELPLVEEVDYMELRRFSIGLSFSGKLKIIPRQTKEYAVSKRSPNMLVEGTIFAVGSDISFDDTNLRAMIHEVNDEGMSGVIVLDFDYMLWSGTENELVEGLADAIRTLGDNMCSSCGVSAMILNDLPYPENSHWDLGFNFIKDKFSFPIISEIDSERFDALIYTLTYDPSLTDEENTTLWREELKGIDKNMIFNISADYANLMNNFIYDDLKYCGWILI